jgi:hypothetical protein
MKLRALDNRVFIIWLICFKLYSLIILKWKVVMVLVLNINVWLPLFIFFHLLFNHNILFLVTILFLTTIIVFSSPNHSLLSFIIISLFSNSQCLLIIKILFILKYFMIWIRSSIFLINWIPSLFIIFKRLNSFSIAFHVVNLETWLSSLIIPVIRCKDIALSYFIWEYFLKLNGLVIVYYVRRKLRRSGKQIVLIVVMPFS